MSEHAENRTIADVAPRETGPRRFISHAACAVGAVLAVVLIGGSLGTSGAWFDALAYALGAGVGSLLSALAAMLTLELHAASFVLRSLPWTLVFYATGIVCAYFACRRVKTLVGRRAVWYSLLALGIEWVLRLIVMPNDADVLLFNRNACAVAAIVLIADVVAEHRRERGLAVSARTGLARFADAFNTAGVAVVAVIVWGVLALCWRSFNQDSYPHATAQLASRYGAELRQMGFQDVAEFTGSNGECTDQVTFEFADGSQDFFPAAIEWGTPDPSLQPQSTPCLSMRMREGKLTVIAPPAAPGMTLAQAEAAEIKGAGLTMVAIRNAYGQIERNREARQSLQN